MTTVFYYIFISSLNAVRCFNSSITGPETFEVDEHPRPTTKESLAKLAPVFKKNGVVTAGNASVIINYSRKS